MISVDDYCALGAFDILGRHYTKKGWTMSIDHRVDRIYSYYSGHKDSAKVYALTKSVVSHIEKMDTSKLTAEAILSISRMNQGDCGAILDPMGQPVKVSSTFAILPECIHMEVFEGAFSKRDIQFDSSGKENSYGLLKHFVGSIVISEAGIELIPNSPIELINRGVCSNVDEYYINDLRAIVAEIKRVRHPGNDTVADIVKAHPGSTRYTQAACAADSRKRCILQYALKCFIYVYASNTIKADYIAEGIAPSRNAKGKDVPAKGYIQVDSLWDTEVNVINPFSVRGHFTHQPYGKGRQLRKLIYIEEYMKTGYHRRATKDITINQQ